MQATPSANMPSADALTRNGPPRLALFRLTLPVVRSVLLAHRRRILATALLGVVAGVVPTLKSELEAGVLDVVSDALRPASYGAGGEGAGGFGARGAARPAPESMEGLRSRVREVTAAPLRRFDGPPEAGDGVPERISRWMFQGLHFWGSLGAYVLVSLGSFLLVLLSAALQARVGKDLFAVLRGVGLKLGLLTDPADLPMLPNPAGQYATAIHQGASTVAQTYSHLLQVGVHLFALLTTLVLVGTKHPGFAFACALLVSAQAGLSVHQARRLRRSRVELDERRNALLGRTDDILSKREILVAYEQQDAYVARLGRITGDYAEVERRLDVAEASYRGLSSLVTDYGRMMVLALAVGLAFAFGRSAIGDVGDAYFLVSIYVRMFVPASNLLLRYDDLRRASSTARTFLAVLATRDAAHLQEEAHLLVDRRTDAGVSTPITAPPATDAWMPGQPVIFDRVSFSYATTPAARGVLHDVSFTIPQGKVTLLVGPSGCGKTTVARLLLGFWRLPRPGITLGGHRIDVFTPTQLRAQMSYVAQGDYIVDDTVRDNLAWGHLVGSVGDDAMRDALAAVGLRAITGYDDLLTAPARALSVGQQQRLSVARMMLDESELVIMDEPLAGVDVFTTRDLLPPLVEVLKRRGHTVLLISHRLAFAAFADHAIVMGADGTVVEEGTPRDLLATGGMFTKLHAAALAELGFGSTLPRTDSSTLPQLPPQPMTAPETVSPVIR